MKFPIRYTIPISDDLMNALNWHFVNQIYKGKNSINVYTKKKRSRDLESNWECMMSYACYVRDLLRKSATTKKSQELSADWIELATVGGSYFKTIYNYLCIYEIIEKKRVKKFQFYFFESESTRKTHSDLISLPAMIQFSSYSYFRKYFLSFVDDGI